MLQRIQFIGSGPPTYVYSSNAVGASNEFYHVFAAETRVYNEREERQERRYERTGVPKRREEKEFTLQNEFIVLDNTKKGNPQEIYQKEYGKRESFLWKQR